MKLAVELLLVFHITAVIGLELKGNFNPCNYLATPKSLICTDQPFGNSFPTIIPGSTKIEYFLIINCDVKSIPANAFTNLTDLKELKISDNYGLKSVHPNALNGLTKLLNLELSNNEFVNSSESLDLRTMLLDLTVLVGFKIERVRMKTLNPLTSNVRRITIIGTGLNAIEANAFAACTSVESLSIIEVFLNGPLTWLTPLSRLTTLNLTATRLTSFSLPPEISKLRTLRLNRNEIKSLSGSSFGRSMTSLEMLDVSDNNGLTAATVLQDLDKLTSLKKLVMQRCKSIETVPTFIRSLMSLEELDLEASGLKRIEINSFPVNRALKVLRLPYSQSLTQIFFTAFNDVPNLRSIVLSHSKLMNIAIFGPGGKVGAWKDIFSRIGNLTEIRMVECGLHDNFWQEMKPLEKLEKIELRNNNFTKIDDFMFAKVTNLQYLSLGNNQINRLSPRSTYGILKSTTFVLSNNRLVAINNCTFENVNLSKLALDGNPLKCDCNLRWLQDKIKTLKVLPTLKCGEGPFKNQVISKITTDFVCQYSNQTNPACSVIPYTTPLPPPPPVTFTLDSNAVVTIDNAASITRWYTHYLVTYTKDSNTEPIKTKLLPVTKSSEPLNQMDRGTNYTVCVYLYTFDAGTNVVLGLSKAHKCSVHILAPIKGASLGLIIGLAVGGVILVILIIVLVICLYKRHLKKSSSKYNKSEEGIYEEYTYPPSTSVYSTGPVLRPPSRRFVRASEVSRAGTESTMIGGPNTPASSRFDLANSTISLAVQNGHSRPPGQDPHRFMSMHNLPTGTMGSTRHDVSMSMDQLNRRRFGPRPSPRVQSSDAILANRQLPAPSEDYTYIEDREQYYSPEEQDHYLHMNRGDIDPNTDPNSQYLSMSSANSLQNIIEHPARADGTLDEEDSYAIGSGPPVPPRPPGNSNVLRRARNPARESQQTLVSNRSSDDHNASYQNPSLHVSATDLGNF